MGVATEMQHCLVIKNGPFSVNSVVSHDNELLINPRSG